LVLVPLLAAGVYALLDCVHDGDSLLGSLDKGVRQALFISAAATTGALLGFAITGVTILMAVGRGPRMVWLTGEAVFRHGVQFVFHTAIVGLSVSTLTFLTLIAVGSNDGFPLGWGMVAAAASALAIDRLWRLVSFLNKLMPIALKDATDDTPLGGTPAVD
jgi:hypothetical protein